MSFDNTKAIRLKHLVDEATTAKQHLAIMAGELIELLAPDPVSLSLPATGWTNGSGVTGYPYYYDVTVTGATANDVATATIAPASMGTAIACGLCAACETRAGAIRFFAASAPAASITGNYILKTSAQSA